jgi:hypothetical protein
MRLKRYDVLKRGDRWVRTARGEQAIVLAATKATAVRKAAALAKRDSRPVTIRIHGLDGRITEERTYPRGADPTRTKG